MYELDQLFGGKVFPNPKDSRNIGKAYSLCDEWFEGLRCSQFFCGLQVVLDTLSFELNHTDGGHRRFVLVEMDKKTAREITSVRLTKVIEGSTERF